MFKKLKKFEKLRKLKTYSILGGSGATFKIKDRIYQLTVAIWILMLIVQTNVDYVPKKNNLQNRKITILAGAGTMYELKKSNFQVNEIGGNSGNNRSNSC